ncbi:MAG: DUF2975 domain-containing protein [Butyrivibrio sp.]|nr:DUF2975 domain-containing protein [Butyrivibrio sp.]
MDFNKKKAYEENVSIKITKAFILILAVAAVGMCILGPKLVGMIMTKDSPMIVGNARFLILLIGGYICATILFVFLFTLYAMVKRIQEGKVFVAENVSSLSKLSNLVLVACIVSFVIGITCTYMIFIITATTAFVTPIIRVIKNAFGKAVEMQDELDYTV